MPESPTQRIILLRHLEPESDKKRIDPKFNEAHLISIRAAILSAVPELVSGFDFLLSSPLERCVNSAHAINEYLKDQNLDIDLTNIQGVTT